MDRSLVYVDVYGITAVVSSNDDGFNRFVNNNYQLFASGYIEKPNIEIFFSKEDGEIARKEKESLPRLSEGLYQNEKKLCWFNEFGFSIYVDIVAPDNWRIYGYHFDLTSQKNKEEILKNYMRSMRWMIHYPVFILLEKYQNKRLVHASVISKNGKAIVFAGLNKVGKSSMARFIFEQDSSYKFISDNFLLTDGEYVYAFPETARLSPVSLNKINVDKGESDLVYGKYHIIYNKERIEKKAVVEKAFIVNNGDELKIESLNGKHYHSVLEGMHRYLQEFPEYTFYSLLESVGFAKKSTELFFTNQNARFYRLELPLNWRLEESSAEVLRCI